MDTSKSYGQAVAGVEGLVRPRLQRLTLVLGGTRSGKSRHAEGLAMQAPAPWTYLATAQAYDDEMRERIGLHRGRRGPEWETIEAPLDLPEALAGVRSGVENGAGVALVDCLTLWLSNLMLAERDVEAAFGAFERALDERDARTVLVSSEVGLGIVPENALARRFRDAAGLLHQRLAARADQVVLMVAGLPVRVK